MVFNFITLSGKYLNNKMFNHRLKYYTLQPGSDLTGLIQIMIMIFGEEPPVFSKPQKPPSALPYPTNNR